MLSGRHNTISHGFPDYLQLDKRLIGFLRQNVPHAQVLQGDALEIIHSISFDGKYSEVL